METTTAPAATVRFAVGDVVTAGAGSDYVWTFTVIRRSAKFVTLLEDRTGDLYRVGIKHSTSGPADAPTVEEYVLPFGAYSMAPVARPPAAR